MKKIKISILVILAIMLNVNVFSQGVGINDDGLQPDSRAILDVKSTTKGVLLPRMTDVQRDALHQNVAEGMLIYNISTHELEIFYNNAWWPLSMGTPIPAAVPPLVTTEAVSCLAANTVTLNGTVNPNSRSANVSFEYGTTTNYGQTVAASQNPVNGNTPTNLLANLTQLSSNTTYHYRIVATNAGGTAVGSDMTFKTLYSDAPSVTDIDGNVYPTVKIGNQIWMAENLRVTKYNNGDPIPWVTVGWCNIGYGVFTYYGNNEAYKSTYGAFYNWYAVNDSRSICPTGWHIPSSAEWMTLLNTLGGYNVAGGQMKAIDGWAQPNVGATNSSGFNAQPAGYLVPGWSSYNEFFEPGISTMWWSRYSPCCYNTDYYSLWYNYNSAPTGNSHPWYYGHSVRCVKD